MSRFLKFRSFKNTIVYLYKLFKIHNFFIKNCTKHIANFFSVFYFAINAGSLCSTFITPLLRESALGYPLAFGVPAALMGVALLAFLFGTKYYIRKPPPGVNIFSMFLGATWTAIRTRCKTPKVSKKYRIE